MRKKEPNRRMYVLRQDSYIPSWVRQEVQAEDIAATQAQMGSTEEIEEVYIKIADKFRVTCPR